MSSTLIRNHTRPHFFQLAPLVYVLQCLLERQNCNFQQEHYYYYQQAGKHYSSPSTSTLLQRTFNEKTIKYYYFKSRAETCLPLLVVLYETLCYQQQRDSSFITRHELPAARNTKLYSFFSPAKKGVFCCHHSYYQVSSVQCVCETHMLYYQGLFFSKSNVLLAYFVIFLDIIEALRKVGIRWIITRGVQDICHPL